MDKSKTRENFGITYSKEFFRKKFTAETMKGAYLAAVKWFSTNVLSKAEFVNVHAKFIKCENEESPTITICLFAVQNGEEDVMEKHCNCCQEMHKSFFINEDTQCNRCSAIAFQRRLDENINIKKNYYKEILRRNGGGDE